MGLRQGLWLGLALVFLLPLRGERTQIPAPKLGKHLKLYRDRSVVFTDELLYIWKKQPLRRAEGDGYIKFDTLHVRCVIRENDLQLYNFLRQQLKRLMPHKFVFHGTVIVVNEVEHYVLVHRINFPKYAKKKRAARGTDFGDL